MEQQHQDIGLLGGSFNPVHKGHLAIARSFLQSRYISQLWILLTPDPPHKVRMHQLSFRQRLTLLKAVFKDEPNVSISTVEKELPQPSYTIRTLEYLAEQYPNTRFWLCLGEDSIRNFTKWHRWEDILGHCELLVARRPSADDLALNKRVIKKAHFITHQPVKISSTEIRERLQEGKNISHLVPEEVLKLIRQQNLYKGES